MAKSVILEELSNGLYLLNQDSSLVSTITFGYSIHSLLVETEIYENNEWYDFMFGINVKFAEAFEGVILISDYELKLISEWLDWICRIIVESNGDHHSYKFMKNFLSDCDYFFSFVKASEKREMIMIEKTRKR